MAQVIKGGSAEKPSPVKKAAAKRATVKKEKRAKKVKAEKAAAGAKRPRVMSKKLNPKELKVAQFLIKERTARLEEMAGVFDKKGTASRSKGNSWARNSLRKLLALKIAKKKDRGTYEALVIKLPAECLETDNDKPEGEKTAKPKKARPKKVKEAKAEEPNGVPEPEAMPETESSVAAEQQAE